MTQRVDESTDRITATVPTEVADWYREEAARTHPRPGNRVGGFTATLIREVLMAHMARAEKRRAR